MATEPNDSFQFPVGVDRGRGQLKREPSYEKYVAQLIRQVLLTEPGERPHRPDFGAGLRARVFGPNDDATASLVETAVFQNLNQWLGALIRVDEVNVTARESTLVVDIRYTIKARGTSEVLNLEVTN